MLITFTNDLDPDQARHSVGPDLDPNHLTLIVFLIEFFENVHFKRKSTDDNKSLKKYPTCKELITPIRPINGRPLEDVLVGDDKLEVLPELCYLGDMLSDGVGCKLVMWCKCAWGKFCFSTNAICHCSPEDGFTQYV